MIPAWNEEKSLPVTLTALKKYEDLYDVLVVDDGSGDSTRNIASQFGIKLITIPINLGVGAAMRAGFKYALANNYSAAVQFDADLQHPIDSIKDLLSDLENFDIVIGSRFLNSRNYPMSFARRLGSVLLGLVLYGRTGLKLTDVTSGFRASSRPAIQIFAEQYPSLYLADTVESLIIASDSNLKIKEISVQMNQRVAGKPSHNPIKSFIHLWRVVLVIISTFQLRRRNS